MSRSSITSGGCSGQDDNSAAVARLRAQFALPFMAAPSAAAAASSAATAHQGGLAAAAPPREQGEEAGGGADAPAGASGAAAASGAARACQGVGGGGEEALGDAEAGQPDGLGFGRDARSVEGDEAPGSRAPAERTRTAAAARQHEGALGALAPDQNPFAPLLRAGGGAAACGDAGAGTHEPGVWCLLAYAAAADVSVVRMPGDGAVLGVEACQWRTGSVAVATLTLRHIPYALASSL